MIRCSKFNRNNYVFNSNRFYISNSKVNTVINIVDLIQDLNQSTVKNSKILQVSIYKFQKNINL
jgi:flagellar biosynthesis/type III secretory pathway chaperone